jgi:hypothetical protein
MKLLFCEDCGDIIAPWPEANKPRDCKCGRHAVWWLNPLTGLLRVCDRCGNEHGWPQQARAYVIGITNLLLHMDGDMTAEKVEAAINAHEDSYLFKRWRSLIIRIRPGESGDTSWAKIPSTESN